MKEHLLKFFSDLISKFKEGGDGLYNLLTFCILFTMFVTLMFDRHSRKKNEKLERQAYWYRTHIVKDGFIYIHLFFSSISDRRIRLNLNLMNRTEYVKEIKQITYDLTDELRFLKYFDNSFFQKIRDNLASFEDMVITNVDFSDDDLRKYKDTLLKKLFDYEINGYKLKKYKLLKLAFIIFIIIFIYVA